MQLRLAGAGVTPFDPQKQQQLINAFMDATAGNLTASQFTVLLVSSAFSSRHRSLLQAPIVVRCAYSTLTSILTSLECSAPRCPSLQNGCSLHGADRRSTCATLSGSCQQMSCIGCRNVGWEFPTRAISTQEF